MGETIRCLMVAAIAMAALLVGPRPAMGQQSFQIPQSLADAVGGATGGNSQPSRNHSSGGSPRMSLPAFTAGDSAELARSRNGGPTTDPVLPRDRNWMSQADAVARPTTDPMPNRSGGVTAAGSFAGADPRSEPDPRLPPNSTSNTQARSKTGTTTFAGLPDGVRLPPRNGNAQQSGASQNAGTFGREFAREGAGGGNPSRPVYGPPTAEQANFDWSVYNNNQSSDPANSRSSASGRSGSDFAGSPQMSATSRSGQTGVGRGGESSGQFDIGTAQQQLRWPSSGLGLPGQAPSSGTDRGASPTTDWTADQIAALGAQFNLSANDPRLLDQPFVNDLYLRYRQWQDRQAAAGQSVSAAPNAGSSFGNSFGDAQRATATPGSAYPDGRGALAGWPSNSGSELNDPRIAANDPRTQPISPSDLAASPSKRSARTKPLYDAFGNRVDQQGNVLDEFGNPVDEATEYELTIGKKLREDMAKLAKQQADLIRQTTHDTLAGPQSRLASTNSPGTNPNGDDVRSNPPAGRPTQNAPGGSVARNEASQTPSPPGFDDEFSRPQVDQAGMAGGADAIGRSNPYVNVFLLCSLVSNAFLFVWLHRLWQHHRDLIASTRMAASGMSSND